MPDYSAKAVFSALLGLLGTAVTIANLGLLITMFRHRRHVSLVPFIGGVSLFAAGAIAPFDLPPWFLFVLLALDPGCSFYVLYAIPWILKRVGARK